MQPKPETVDGVSGMLLWRGTRFGILYATHIDNEGFQRFCVSHELGHYLLPGHLDHLSRADNGWPASRAGFVSTDPYELEADYFATGLLVPEPWFFAGLPGGRAGTGDGATAGGVMPYLPDRHSHALYAHDHSPYGARDE